jgi:glucose-6-phosphate isomerase, archaeal
MKLDCKPLELEFENGKLYLSGKELKPDVRTIGQMKGLLFDMDTHKANPEMPTYFMYRDLMPELKTGNIRYDVTIILPVLLGHEFNKTFGHYHPNASAGLSFPELYNVLSGEAHYLLQKQSAKGEIEDVLLVKAKKGDAVIMPPNYGHITINPGKTPLIMANLVCPSFSSEYEEYEHNRGGAYYELEGEKLLPNPSYGIVPKIKIKKGSLSAKFKPNILAAYLKDPKPFDFLKDPRLFSLKS